MTKEENRQLLCEAQKTNYSLRSTFFYRKLNELGFMEFGHQVEELTTTGSAYQWEERGAWGISESAWKQIQEAGIEPLRVFAHPLVCVQNPRLLGYYRSVAVLSQKGAATLAVSGIGSYESGRRDKLPHAHALNACQVFNRHISAIIDSTLTFTRRDIDALLFASAGAQIDGSWRNAVGEEAEALVRRLILNGFLRAAKIANLVKRDGSTVSVAGLDEADLVENFPDYRGATLTNGTSVLFSSEPDVSLRATDGRLLAAIEIKGGTDPAGALERLGAAQKSFTEAQRENSTVHTLFVASCITPEMAGRLEQARQRNGMFHDVVNLSELLTQEEARTAFLEKLLQLLQA